jgi:tripartite-type tricarboxylate transporter receptor subunit TctC
MFNTKRRLVTAAMTAICALMALPGVSWADFPNRPIRILIGYAAGGGTDIVARLLAPRLSDELKVPVVVENRPGAAGLIAEGMLAKAPADGYTILMDPLGITMNPSVFRKVPYDPIKDIQPVAQIFSQPFVIVVNAALPVRDLKELVALMRAKPKDMNVAVAGTSTQLAAELFKLKTGVDLTLIPFKGSAPASASLVAGDTQVMFSDLPSVKMHITSGRLRALAIMGNKPVSSLPDVRPASESGLFDDNVSSWSGIFAPGGTPPTTVATLNAAITKVLRMPDISAQIVRIGADPVITSVDEFSNFYRSELVRWKEVVERAKIQPVE